MKPFGIGGVRWLIPAVVVALASACDSPARPTPPPVSPASTVVPVPPPAPVPPPVPVQVPYRLSGLVTDDGGSPLGDASVVVDYATSEPPPGAFLWLPVWVKTRTDSAGRYQLDFEAIPSHHWVPSALPNFAGVLRTWHDDFEGDARLVPTGTTDVTRNVRLRRAKTINAGESFTVSVEADSGLCFDFDTQLSLTTVCEWFRVAVGPGETLTAEARPAEPGGFVPQTIVLSYRAGLYRVGVSVPTGTAPQHYVVSTSTRESP